MWLTWEKPKVVPSDRHPTTKATKKTMLVKTPQILNENRSSVKTASVLKWKPTIVVSERVPKGSLSLTQYKFQMLKEIEMVEASTSQSYSLSLKTTVISGSLLQWNCRGFKGSIDELYKSLLCCNLNPVAICLQETHLKASGSFKCYITFNKHTSDGGQASGGSSILVRSDMVCIPVALNTILQAAAVRLTLHKTITLCSIYIPPNSILTLQELDSLVRELPSTYLLLGDFSGHNSLWGGNTRDTKGKRIEDLVDGHAVCVLNNGSYTYLHPAYGTYSAIVLSIV